MKILKFEIPLQQEPVAIEMPAAARLVFAAAKNASVYLWFETYGVDATVTRVFQVFPTGVPTEGRHRATAATSDLMFVWHVYEQET